MAKKSDIDFPVLKNIVKLFSGIYSHRRLDSGRVSHSRDYVMTTLVDLGKTGPFWKRPKRNLVRG